MPLLNIYALYIYSNAVTDNQYKEGTLRKVSTETETLRSQVAQLKRLNDNALAETRFVYSLIFSIYFI